MSTWSGLGLGFWQGGQGSPCRFPFAGSPEDRGKSCFRGNPQSFSLRWGLNNLSLFSWASLVRRAGKILLIGCALVNASTLRAQSIAAGSAHSLFVDTNGHLWAWGNNGAGQLGDVTKGKTRRLQPLRIGVETNWDKVFADGNTSFAIKKDGSLWSWGDGELGQLGDGTMTNRPSPVRVGGAFAWAQLSVRDGAVLALRGDGTLWAWGKNTNGTLGLGRGRAVIQSQPVQIGTNLWQSVAVGKYFYTDRSDREIWTRSFGVDGEGRVWTWGQDPERNQSLTDYILYSPRQIGEGTNWTKVASPATALLGLTYNLPVAVGLREDGTLWQWNGDSQTFRPIGEEYLWSNVVCGLGHALARQANGTLWTWGLNEKRQLGRLGQPPRPGVYDWAKFTTVTTNAPGNGNGGGTGGIYLPDTTRFSVTYEGNAATNSQSGQYGVNYWAGLAYGSSPPDNSDIIFFYSASNAVHRVEFLDVSPGSRAGVISPALALSGLGAFIKDQDGEVIATNSVTLRFDRPISVFKQGPGYDNQSGILRQTDDRTLVGSAGHGIITFPGDEPISSFSWEVIASDEDASETTGFTVGILQTTNLIWRADIPRQMGLSNLWSELGAGGGHSLGWLQGRLMAWGDNSSGQCGGVEIPERLQPQLFGTGPDWAQILPGRDFVVARKTNGVLYAWGNAEATNREALSPVYEDPVPIRGENDEASSGWQKISVLETASSNSVGKRLFGLKDGILSGWGGRDGLGEFDPEFRLPWWDQRQDTFGVLPGTWRSLSANVGKGDESHALAVRSDGTLWAWGANLDGQLGDGTRILRDAPNQVGSGNHWKEAFAGGAHSLALQVDGSLWVWGNNSNGALGLSTNTVTVSNLSSGGTNSTNSTNSTARVFAGRTRTTTINLATNVYRPALVLAKGWGVEELSAGGGHNLILRRDGSLWAMGANDQGQLGTGKTVLASSNTNSSSTNTNGNTVSGARTVTVTRVITNINFAPPRIETNVDITIDQSWMYRIQRVGQKQWKTVSAGNNHSLGVRADGTLWGWGGNESGQVGDGTRLSRDVPVQIGPANNWRQVWAGRSASFAMKTDGTLYRWGDSTNLAGLRDTIVEEPAEVAFGKLGLGTLILRKSGAIAGLGLLSFQPGSRYADLSVQLGTDPGSRIQFSGGTNFSGGAQSILLPTLGGVFLGQSASLVFSPLRRQTSAPLSSYVGTARWNKQLFGAELVLGSDRDGDGFPDETDALPDGPLPKLTSPKRVVGRVGEVFQYEILATAVATNSNFPTPFVCESDLPSGLVLNKATGMISGTPTKVGQSQLVVGAENVAGISYQVLNLTIIPARPAINSAASVVWTNGTEPFFFQVTATQTNHPDYPVRFRASGLPSGLAQNFRNGAIAPGNRLNTTLPAPGLYRARLVVSNPEDRSASNLLISSVGARWQVGQPLRFRLSQGGEGPVEISNLPAGLRLNPRTGVLSGIPTTAGHFELTARQRKEGGGWWEDDFTLTIGTAPRILAADSSGKAAPMARGSPGWAQPAIFSLGPVASSAPPYQLIFTNVEKWKWDQSTFGTASRLQESETEARKNQCFQMRKALPTAVRLAWINYAFGEPGGYFPTNHPGWLRDQDGTPLRAEENPELWRVDFSRPDFLQRLADRVRFLVENGCVQGVYLPEWDEAEFWPEDSLPQKGNPGESQLIARLELLRTLRTAVGESGWIVAEASGESWVRSGEHLDGVHVVAATEPPPGWPPAEGWWPDPYLARGKEGPLEVPLTLWERIGNSLRSFGQPGILRKPGAVFLEIWGRHDLRDPRTRDPRLTGLALSLCLSDGAYLYAWPDWWQVRGKPVSPGQHLWMPEWSLRLGQARQPRLNHPDETGIFRRQYYGGWAVYAPITLAKPAVVRFEEELTSVSSGKTGKSHRFVPGFGDLLLKKK